MSIKIKQINVKNLGPINKLEWEPGTLNLIYGHNEKGKTYLVEFLAHSLFKNSKMQFRAKSSSGKIVLKGLSNNKSKTFSPNKTIKLEDFLVEKYHGLPPDISTLLICKGTNVELGDSDETDRIILRRYLSNKEILDKTKNNIDKTIANAKISGYSIGGDMRGGKIREQQKKEQKLNKINELFKKIENQYLSGEIKILLDKKNKLNENFIILRKAKRHKAFLLSKEIKELTEQSKKIDDKKINSILQQINNLRFENQNQENQKQKLKKLEPLIEHYEWLEKAINTYEKYNLEQITEKPKSLILILLLLMIVLTIVSFILKIEYIPIASFVLSVYLGWLYKKEYDKKISDLGKSRELDKIKKNFKIRFKEKYFDYATMKEKLEEIEGHYHTYNAIEEQIFEKEKFINNKIVELNVKVNEIIGKTVEKNLNTWEKILKEKLQTKTNIKNKIIEKDKKLSTLNIEEKDYLAQKPEVEYDKQKYENLKSNLDDINNRISDKEHELNFLKQSACGQTGDDINIGWEILISNLQNKREEILEENNTLIAEIIAGKLVSDVLEELYTLEDEKIAEALTSNKIKNTIFKVTGHYNNIYLEKDNMFVSDNFNDFPVSRLSDGAKEQIFLSLRIGMAIHWFNTESMFLIFDDAFIHSDYKRRESLIKKVFELTESGWQIFCFTFDNHIKELFEKKSSKYKIDFKLLNLNKI